ncbi:hypothetical protein B0A55_11935 [Friedmanniomyces simplex]|uniref:F-box domain-containing protein n=1 Tax=Friedmanniomyces simplex TaxID=329884 RepID=A0A4U0WAJ9_9PEZI|nr:hypothetical protein B0A55_11935 [Friedmanniomyces simplex]
MSLELYVAESDNDLIISRDPASVHQHGKKATTGRAHREIMDRLLPCNTPADAVLTTYELLELIVLQLPVRNLVIARCVNMNFYAVISRPEKLQRALYLKAEDAEDTNGASPVLNENVTVDGQQLGPWRLVAHTYRPVGNGGHNLTLLHELNDGSFSRAKPLALCGRAKTGLWQQMYITQPVCRRVDVGLRFRSHQLSLFAISFTFFRPGATMGEVQNALV